MTQETKYVLILISPFILGGLIAVINVNGINKIIGNGTAWLKKKQTVTSIKKGLFYRYIINPVLWIIVKFCSWTDSFSHAGLRNGISVTATLYLLAAWLFLVYVAFAIIVVLVLGALAIYLAIKIISNSNSDVKRGYERGKAVGQSLFDRVEEKKPRLNVNNMAGVKGRNIYSGTSWLNEELKGRVDEEGNIYSGTNWFNEQKIGRIDEEGNIFRGTHFLNEEKVGRIDEGGNIHKGTNWLNETKVGRVDEDGNVFKGTSWLNERKTGRSGD